MDVEPVGSDTSEFRLLKSFPAMIWRSRPEDGLCDWFNDTWLEFTGRSLEQEWGDGWTEGVHPEDLDRCLEIYTTAFARRESFGMEYRLRRHDGVYRWILDLGRPFTTEEGDFGGYIGACYDVSDRREMIERLQAAQTTTTMFLQTLYHDLRSPLAALEMATQTLENPDLGDAQRASMKRIMDDNLERARRILDGVRLLDQSSSGTLRPRLVDVRVEDLLERVVGAVDTAEHPVEVETDVETVMVDPVIVDRALENLVRNAAAHTPRATPIHVRVGCDDSTYRFEVADDGPGIEPDVLAGIFDPRPTRGSPTSGGFGIGLSLVRRYVEAHAGTVSIDSEVGRGTRVLVTLPRPKDVSDPLDVSAA